MDNDRTAEAEKWIRKAMEIDKSNDILINLGSNCAFCAHLFKRKGDRVEAKKNLDKAIEIFKSCGANGWAMKFENEIVSLL